ncbi:MAG: hypothetical protein AAFW70_25580, partial [Cyanobacteria bacterium J06635_10]
GISIQNPKSKIPLEKFRGEESETVKFPQNRIVEATGWVVDENGDLFFIAGKPNGWRDNSKGVGC